MAEEWIRNRPEVPAAGLYVIARNAYSEFYCLSLEGGCIVKLSYPTGVIVAPKGLLKLKGGAERAAQTFLIQLRASSQLFILGRQVLGRSNDIFSLCIIKQ